ncbi:transcriptional regulator, LysR family [Sphingomonas laterariae]|uniref:Transcriptional regulator, LysR family n=1 Tax=Edaphosphingomonas laterariae TaxID=861865 RepID=A0A239HQE5_9SPHN|nr:LysR family transcriptional regulator [Sphingomonas laterariae]SNS83308.1 transcriptional regulator, LysR family [Sphingomonas laterariae]
MLEARDLLNIARVAQYGSIQRAAISLGLTQPALSKAIARLEDELQLTLFDRHGRGATLTEAGRLALERGKPILLALADLGDTLGQMRGLEYGSITIGIGPLVREAYLGTVLRDFVSRFPHIRVAIRVGAPSSLVRLVQGGEVDFAVVAWSPADDDPDLDVSILGEEEIAVAMRPGHPLATRAEVAAQDISAFPLIAPFTPSQIAAPFIAALRKRGTTPFKLAVVCDDFRAALPLVTTSDHIFLATRSSLATHVGFADFVVKPLQGLGLSLNPCLVRRRTKSLSLAADHFATLLRQCCAA